jgi:adenine-specific DNA methylase
MMRSRKKLSMMTALPPYLGGKRRLCPLIFREIDRILPRRCWRWRTFLDAFLGGGSVSLYAKAQGFRVVACDIAERAVTVGKALIENSRVKLINTDIFLLTNPVRDPPGRIEREYAPKVFTQEQARFLDRALNTAARTEDPSKAALLRLLAIRVALLAHPMSQVRPGTIHRLTTGEVESITESCLYHYVDGLRLTFPDKMFELERQINAGVFQGEGKVHKASVLDILPRIPADVVYFDPPYPGVMSYEKEYRIIDEILEGRSRPTSPFTAKDGASLLDTLFEKAKHIPVWLLSLGNAVVSIEELEAKMAKHGRQTKAIALKYQHLPAVATAEKKRKNREFLVVGWDPNATLIQAFSVDRASSLQKELGRNIDGAVTDVHDDPNSGGSKGPPAEPFLLNADKQGRTPLPEQVASERRSPPVPEEHSGVNLPDPVLGESSLGRDSELRVDTPVRHGPTVDRKDPRVK